MRTQHPLTQEQNEEALRVELDLIDEVQDQASIAEALVKKGISNRYNWKVIPREFDIGDLILRHADVGQKNAAQGKLAANWEGPYRVVSKTVTRVYELETLDRKPIKRTWNAAKLRAYFN